MKAFFEKKGIADYLSLCCFVLTLLGLLLYLFLGRNEFSKDISLLCVVPGIISVSLFLLSFLRHFPFVSEFACFLSLFSFVSYIGSQANYLANVFTAIDGSKISVSFVFTFAFLLLGFLMGFILLFFGNKKAKTEIKIVCKSKEAGHE